MTDIRKNKSNREEEAHLLQFLRETGILRFAGRPDCRFAGRPDCILDANGKRLGVEHTRVLRDRKPSTEGSREYQREHTEEQIVEEAKALYVADRHYSLNVNVSFNDIIPIPHKHIPLVAQQLCGCIRELEPHIVSGYLGPFDWQFNPALKNQIPEAVNLFWASRASYKNDHWNISDGGSVGALQPHLIQMALDDKEKKLAAYRSNCDLVWVLVVAAGSKMSSYFNRDDAEFLEATYISGADAVYLLDEFANKVHHLRAVSS